MRQIHRNRRGFQYWVYTSSNCHSHGGRSEDGNNYLTDGDLRISGLNCIKNIDDLLIYSDTLEGLKKEIQMFLEVCKKKNLKLKTIKFCIGEEVKFGGPIISSETVGKETIVCVLPKKKSAYTAFQNLKKPKTKRNVQEICGMFASLQTWNPSILMNATNQKAATGARGKFV